MTRSRLTDDAFDLLMTTWLDDRARSSGADDVAQAALARTSRMRPRPAWSLPERWVPMQLTTRLQPTPRVAPILILIILIVAAIAIAIVAAGHRRNVPEPFGLAANGVYAWVQDGQIVTGDLGGSSAHAVTSGPSTYNRPVFSRDGTRLAYERFADASNGIGDVIVAEADGSHAAVLDHDIASLGDLSWSPDARYLAYMVGTPASSHASAFAVTSVDGSGRTLIDTLPGDAWNPSWSPDGRRLAVGVFTDGHTDLYVVDRDGSNARRLNVIRSNEGGDTAVEWSPDGTTIAYSAGDPETAMRVYLVGLDGAPERQVSATAAWATNPVFSPDGSRLAYMQIDGSRGARVVIADRTGASIKTLPGFYYYLAPAWSPDGTRIAATSDDPSGSGSKGPAVVAILDVDGNAPPVNLPAPNLADEHALTWQRLAP